MFFLKKIVNVCVFLKKKRQTNSLRLPAVIRVLVLFYNDFLSVSDVETACGACCYALSLEIVCSVVVLLLRAKGQNAGSNGGVGGVAQSAHLVGCSYGVLCCQVIDSVCRLTRKADDLAVLDDGPAQCVVAVVPTQFGACQLDVLRQRSLFGQQGGVPVDGGKHIVQVADLCRFCSCQHRIVAVAAVEGILAAAEVYRSAR